MGVSILDYGASNLLNVVRAFEAIGVEVSLVDSAKGIIAADRLVLPGVGAFGAAIEALRENGLSASISEFHSLGRPLLGICLGMQLLATKSEEFGEHCGLDLISGQVEKMPQLSSQGNRIKVPHIGWNELDFDETNNPLFDQIPAQSPMYFVHSYLFKTNSQTQTIATCSYEMVEVPAIVYSENAIGLQFHPEKSGSMGLQMLKNFTKL